MRHCAKCDWLGIMGPCPHEGEPFPIYRQRRPAPERYIPDVSEFIERGLPDSEIDDLDPVDAEDLEV